ncbi:MAG: peptide ABC transporter substrate-binding protein [Betaproteobacteria bacterium]|nr:peptide ABC transporter substrate-binding protein [Betaproteobacteria bacterium]NBS46880.1 peptide ABC transporter substrate-binding protein [Betaproteobacteria bacterium]
MAWRPWIFALIAASMLGCLPTGAATVPPGVQLHATQTLVRNNGAEPETLDPALAESVGANNITRDLFEGLTAMDSAGRVVPGVAQSWSQGNPTTWTFKLRANARWSNGDPVTADDFVYGIRRFADPRTGSKYAATFGSFLLHGREVTQGSKPPAEIGVRAIDKLTLEIRTAFPVSFLPALVSNNQFGPIHRATVEKHGRDWTKPGRMVGNGAYVLKDWQVNNRIVIEKNPQYWDAANVQLTRVTYLPIEDASADIKLFESGENDWVYQLPPGTFEKYRAQYPREIRNTPILGLRYYSFNTRDPFFRDVRVRKALSMVIDRDLLAQKVTADGQAPAYSVMVPGVEGADVTPYDWAQWPMERRIAEARKLLEQAGVKPGSRFSLAYNTSEYHKKMAIFAASEWKNKLGLVMETESMEFKVLLRRRHDGQFQMARNGWLADYNDATTFLALIKCDSDQNNNFNCNREAEALIQQGLQSADPARRKALLTDASRMIMEDYPIIPLLQYSVPRLIRPWVGGYGNGNPQDRHRSQDLYIVRH